jgi:hypothetical protein
VPSPRHSVGDYRDKRQRNHDSVDYIEQKTSAIQEKVGESYWIGIALFPLALGLIIGGICACVASANRMLQSDFAEVAIRTQRLRRSAALLMVAGGMLALSGLFLLQLSLSLWMP